MWAPCCQETVSHSGQLLRPFMQDDLGCSKQKGMHWVRGLTSPPIPSPIRLHTKKQGSHWPRRLSLQAWGRNLQ